MDTQQKIETGAASVLIELSAGTVTVKHGADDTTILLQIKNAEQGSWNKIWNALSSIKSTTNEIYKINS